MRIRTMVITTALAAASLATTALPASAAGQVCYDLYAEANGEALVDESGCEDLPL